MKRRDFLLSGLAASGGLGSFLIFRAKDPLEVHEPGTILRPTTIDLEVSDVARRMIVGPVRRRKVNGRRLPPDVECAFACIENSTGYVRAFIPNANGRNEDYARLGNRDAASIFKPVLYAIGLSSGAIDPDQRFLDAPRTFSRFDEPEKTYQVKNFGGQYEGRRLTIPEAIALSSNTVATAALHLIGPETLTKKMEEMDFPTADLGPQAFNLMGIGRYAVPILQLASAYAALANGGVMNAPRFVPETAVEGKDGAEIRATRRVFTPEACNIVLSGMEGCLRFGTGRVAADLAAVARAKTGSTEDALAAIVTKNFSAVLWIGRRKSNADMKLTGGGVALPLLADFFRELIRRRPSLFPRWS